MKIKIFPIVSMLMVAMLLMACVPEAQTTEQPDGATPAVHGDPTEAKADLLNALRSAGAEVELGDSVEQAFFSVTGQILKVNGVDVQVFEYASAEAMEADAAQVSADGGSVGTSMVMWVEAPHFFKSGRLLVLYVGEDAAILDLLKSVLGEQFAGR